MDQLGFLVFLILLGSLDAQDYQQKLVDGVVSHNKTLDLVFESPYKSPQVVLQARLQKHDNISSNGTAVQFSTSLFDPTTNQTTVINTMVVNNTDFVPPVNMTACAITPDNVPVSGLVFTTNVSTLGAGPAYVSQASITLLNTQLTNGAQFSSGYPQCPGSRYFYVSVPLNDYAHDITISLQALTAGVNVSSLFSGIYMKANACPDVSNNIYDLAFNFTSDGNLPKVSYTYRNVMEGGLWWIQLPCAEAYPAYSMYTIQITAKQTCTYQCFKHGSCLNRPAFCQCNAWWDGTNCEKLFRGDFTLMVVASLFLIGLIACIIYRVVRCSKNKEPYSPSSPLNSVDDELTKAPLLGGKY